MKMEKLHIHTSSPEKLYFIELGIIYADFELHINLSLSWTIVKEWNIPADDSPNSHVFSGSISGPVIQGPLCQAREDDYPAHKQGSVQPLI